jgi:hypothetical protein
MWCCGEIFEGKTKIHPLFPCFHAAIEQGITDFVSSGIDMTITLNTGEVGLVNLTVENQDGFITLQITSITTLRGESRLTRLSYGDQSRSCAVN